MMNSVALTSLSSVIVRPFAVFLGDLFQAAGQHPDDLCRIGTLLILQQRRWWFAPGREGRGGTQRIRDMGGQHMLGDE
jgi:hypothetical protein